MGTSSHETYRLPVRLQELLKAEGAPQQGAREGTGQAQK